MPALVKALDDGDVYVEQDAAWALEQIGTKEAKKAAKAWHRRWGR